MHSTFVAVLSQSACLLQLQNQTVKSLQHPQCVASQDNVAIMHTKRCSLTHALLIL